MTPLYRVAHWVALTLSAPAAQELRLNTLSGRADTVTGGSAPVEIAGVVRKNSFRARFDVR